VKYFRIRPDSSIKNLPVITDFISTLTKPKELKDEASILHVKSEKVPYYPDYMEKPLLLVSDEFKKVAKLYNKDYVYKAVMLMDKSGDIQNLYWNLDIPAIECLSPMCTYNHDGTLKKIVINESAFPGGVGTGMGIFKIKDKLWSIYVVHLSMAESLLRRGLHGFTLEELSHENREDI